jgi:hypothetical protein
MALLAVGTSYERSAASLKERFFLELAHRPVQRVTRDCTEAVEEFMGALPPPASETEGPILVHTVDCKGIRMRPEERNPDQVKTEDNPGENRMACVAQTYSVDVHFRSNEGIVAAFFGPSGPKSGQDKEPRRPKPMNRRTFATLKHPKSELFRAS